MWKNPANLPLCYTKYRRLCRFVAAAEFHKVASIGEPLPWEMLLGEVTKA